MLRYGATCTHALCGGSHSCMYYAPSWLQHDSALKVARLTVAAPQLQLSVLQASPPVQTQSSSCSSSPSQ
jgi:hypothetical protein